MNQMHDVNINRRLPWVRPQRCPKQVGAPRPIQLSEELKNSIIHMPTPAQFHQVNGTLMSIDMTQINSHRLHPSIHPITPKARPHLWAPPTKSSAKQLCVVGSLSCQNPNCSTASLSYTVTSEQLNAVDEKMMFATKTNRITTGRNQSSSAIDNHALRKVRVQLETRVKVHTDGGLNVQNLSVVRKAHGHRSSQSISLSTESNRRKTAKRKQR